MVKKNLRHREENYYSVRVIGENNRDLFIVPWHGNIESLARDVNEITNNKWTRIKVLKYTQYVDLYKKSGSPIVCQRRAKTHHDFVGKNKVLNIYVDDSVKSGRDIRNMLERQYKYVYGSPGMNTNLPRILTGVVNRTRYGVVYGTNHEEKWQETYATVVSPNPKCDVIINRSGKQIWPRNTGALPRVVQEFFIKRQKD